MEVRLKQARYKGVSISKERGNLFLVRWSSLNDKNLLLGYEDVKKQDDDLDVFVWMDNKEIAVCCPDIKMLDDRNSEESASKIASDVSGLQSEVIIWSDRIKQAMVAAEQSGPREADLSLLANTMNILSAYAKFSFLADTFKSCGAIDISLKLLSNPQASDNVRKYARETLLTLSASDSQTNSYILSMLMKEENEPSVENREVLLDISQFMLKEIRQKDIYPLKKQMYLAQISGSVLCSLVKKYLKISAIKTTKTAGGSAIPNTDNTYPQEKIYFDLVFDFVKDFLEFHGCFANNDSVDRKDHHFAGTSTASIFGGIMPGKLNSANTKQRSDFKSEEEYTKYLQHTLKPGMKVKLKARAMNDRHEYYGSRSMKEGAIGEFVGTVSQPKFKWKEQSLFHSSSVNIARPEPIISWEQVELMQQGKQQSSEMTAIKKKPNMPSFMQTQHSSLISTSRICASTILTRNQWWEILSALQKMSHIQIMDTVLSLTKSKNLDELIRLSPSVADAVPVIMLLKTYIPFSIWESFAIVQEIHLQNPDFYIKNLTDVHHTGVIITTPSTRLEAPYPDPFILDKDTDLSTQLVMKEINHDDSSSNVLLDGNQDQSFASYLRAIETLFFSSFTSSSKKIVTSIRTVIKNNPGKCKIAVLTANSLLSGITKLKKDRDYGDCCEAEMFNLVLELMSQEPSSCILQTVCIKCFYFLMGCVNDDGLISHVSSTVMSTIISLVSSSEKSAIMKILVDGIKCIADYYHSQLSEIQKKSISDSIGYGTLILATILNQGDFLELSEKYKQWGVPSMIESVKLCNVSFTFKKELCFFLSRCETDHCNTSNSVDWLIELFDFSTFSNNLPSIKDLNYNMFTHEVPHTKGKRFGLFVGVVTRYLNLLGITAPLTDQFISLPEEASKIFVDRGTVLHLSNIIMSSDNEGVKRVCIVLMGCLSMNIDVCEVLATQGGLEAVQSILQSKQLNESLVIDVCVRLLFNMSQSETAFSLMVDWVPSLSTLLKTSFHKFKVKIESNCLKELMIKLSNYEDTIEITTLKVLRNLEIFSNTCLGFMDIILDYISKARRNNQMPSIPFIKKIFKVNCKKSSINGVDRVEASSGESQVSHLMDGNPDTYWESRSSGTTNHWIKLHMADDTLVKKLSVTFHERCLLDDITLKGLNDCGNQVNLKTIQYSNFINSSDSNDPVTILEDLDDHYSELQIVFTLESGYRRVLITEVSCDTVNRTTPFDMLFTKFIIQTQFYYSIQCQTWTTELPLTHVFNKVTESLHYEQNLADYLGLSYNQQVSLGKACKLSLIDKFVEIASKGDDLIQLMESYLLSVNVSTSAINVCSTITSLLNHVYHFTDSHSFVLNQDCDMSKKIKLSATRRMCGFFIDCCLDTEGGTHQPFFMQTWTRVIKLAYATFFKQADFSCHPLIVMTELFIFNEKAKQAAAELFKGHPLGLMVTRSAIWDAACSLKLETRIKLCHSMCVSIHQLISTKTVESTELMTVLSEFTNLLPFFTMFEHLYRKYLIERTLSSSKINVSLEWSVAKIFAGCFPSATPLSMIEDLMKSESCFDGFKQFCLNAFDQELYKCHHIDVASHHQKSEAASVSVDRLMAYQLVEFHVTILSPYLWPSGLNSIPMQALDSIHPLPIFVADYNAYFSREGKTVTWTQYGSAQIQCNTTSIILNVSTIQMAIIMTFNNIKSKKVSFHKLVERTGFSSMNIRKALDALTIGNKDNHGEPLLTVSAGEYPNDKSPPTPSYQAQPSSSTNEYYSINENLFRKLLSCGNVHEVSFNATTGTEIKANDLQIISKRRRDIVQTQIVKLMKRQRKLNTYEIYSSIKAVCSSKRFHHWFGNFDCSYYDIQTEIDSLVQTGFIKRHDSNPLIIEYVVDIQSNHSDKTNDTSPSSLCEPNSIEFENIPLFQMPLIKDMTSMQTIKEVIQSDISTIATILNIGSDLAECLLSDCSWNMQKMLNSYLEDEEYCKKKGFKFLPLDKSRLINDNGCPICLNQEISTFIPLWCGHICCTECWYKYFQIVIKSAPQTIAESCCMYNDCFVKPTTKFVGKIVDKKPDGDLILTKFRESISHVYIKHNHWLSFCKNPQGCDGIVACSLYSKEAFCEKCSWNSCVSCNFIEAHDPASCEDIRRWVEAGGFHQGMNDEAKSAYLANKIAKQCPKCKMQIEKNEGCLHMVCKCGHHFCWKCLKNWSENHTNYFECEEEANHAANNNSRKFMEQNSMCEKIYESKVGAEGMLRQMIIAGEGGRLPIKVFPILRYAWSMLIECYKVQFYLQIVKFFNKSLESFSILNDDLVSKTAVLQSLLDTFTLKAHDNTFEKYSLKSEEFVCDTSKLLALIQKTLRKVLYGVKECFRLSAHDPSSSNSECHSVNASEDIEQLLLPDNLKDKKVMEGQQDILYWSGTGPTVEFITRLARQTDSPVHEYYDDDDDDDDDYYFDDDDYYGGYSS